MEGVTNPEPTVGSRVPTSQPPNFFPDKTRGDDFGRKDDAGIRAPGYSPPQFEDKKTTIEAESNEFEGVRTSWSLNDHSIMLSWVQVPEVTEILAFISYLVQSRL